jgi:hypothetical protein
VGLYSRTGEVGREGGREGGRQGGRERERERVIFMALELESKDLS